MSRMTSPATVVLTLAVLGSALNAEAQAQRPPGSTRVGQPAVIAPQPAPGPQNTTPVNAPAAKAPAGGVAAHVFHRLQNVNEIVLDPARGLKADAKKLRSLYQIRAWEPIFITAQGRTAMADALIPVLQQQAPQRGLDTEYYLTQVITNRWLATDQEGLLALEFALTSALVDYASDLSVGRIELGDVTNLPDIKLFGCWNGKTPIKCEFKAFQTLNGLLASPQTLVNGIHQFEPQDIRYKNLIQVMNRLLQVKKAGGWPKFGKLRTVRPVRGERDPSLALLRQRLADIGLMTPEEVQKNYGGNLSSLDYDEFLQEKVMALQDNNELTFDKVIGAKTWKVIDKPVQAFIDQVKANLERWRLLPRNLGDRYILVNLGLQWLQVYDQGKLELPMKVVIGQESRRTPSLIDAVYGIKFRPSWSSPDSIAAKDLFPKIQANPGYIEEQRYVIYEGNWKRKLSPEEAQSIPWDRYSPAELAKNYKIRQQPGLSSALGVVKFELSNGDDIYLHDTGHREGFALKTRFASSGCIRLEKPLELAEYLLRDQQVSREDADLLKHTAGMQRRGFSWDFFGQNRTGGAQDGFRFDLETIKRITNDEEILDRRLKMTKPFRVYIVAFTADSGEDQVVNLTGGVYQQDDRIVAAMNGFRFSAAELEEIKRQKELTRLGSTQIPTTTGQPLNLQPGFNNQVHGRPGQQQTTQQRRPQQGQEFNPLRLFFQW